MILPQLLLRFLRHRDDAVFYRMQAVDAIRWLEGKGIRGGAGRTALDLGCGHGVFGTELMQRGWKVAFADESNGLHEAARGSRFLQVNLDRDPIGELGRYDLVVCSNVLEHLRYPDRLIAAIPELLNPGGVFYLSWTNWLSPWGGHEFSPWHYLGTRLGPAIYDRLSSRKRFHVPHQNLFPTRIGGILATIRGQKELRVSAMAPRYYTELAFVMRVPILREFLAWNAALLIGKAGTGG